ncbi:serine carboxypeptidase-like [Impatiens glandulifera]|uniref:serine carboxypeptidase-like n=1 Tax=Impatiens glandulifera TaxID=253017 RepID=UPI001FB17038|nr:serine carboxypeptidase-like [Impatiens glandulifera]
MGLSSCIILFPLLFFSCPILSSSSSPLRTSKVNNSKLFPSSGVNSSRPSFGRLPDAVLSSSLVEKQFRLPVHAGPSIQNLGHYAGYYRLPHSKDARMFYYFFESRNNKRSDPVVIWLSGGPGYSSSIALFYENGPYHITNNNYLIWNDYGWDQVSNMIYVDQPTGTGFSYSSDKSDIRVDQEGVSNDLYDFLQAFFAEHLQYLRNDFYITGESYAGHYIPVLASRIHSGNINGDGALINLKGLAIGNRFTDPVVQYKSIPDYALRAKLITKSQARKVARFIPACENDAAKCRTGGGEGGRDSCIDAHTSCSHIHGVLLRYIGSMNYFDTRKECVGKLCYDFSYMEKLLNEESVKSALGVGNIKFVSLSPDVNFAMIKDRMRNHAVRIPPLLEKGIKVLLYVGEYDIVCNWIGISRWVQAMKWSGQKKFNATSIVPFEVNGVVKGRLKEYGPLSFLKFYKAGHMVPMDQPKTALKMLKRWTQGTSGAKSQVGNAGNMGHKRLRLLFQ